MANEGGVAPKNTNMPSGVGQTANVGRATSVGSGAAKVFREFKWGLLTLFLLMVVVVGLVYDGGRRKKNAEVAKLDERGTPPSGLLDAGVESGLPPIGASGGPSVTPPAPLPDTGTGTAGLGVPGSNIVQNDLGGSRNNVNTQQETVTPPVQSPGHTIAQNNQTPGVGTPHEPRSSVMPLPQLKPEGKPLNKPETVVVQGGEKTYKVETGDTLTSIVAKNLPGKGGMKAILEANKDVLPNPNKLRVGMTLKIPAASAAPVVAGAEVKNPGTDSKVDPKLELVNKPTPNAGGAANEYVVQSGDTLERIARKVFNDGRKWRDIYEWNRDQLPEPGRLKIGMLLKIKQGLNGGKKTADAETGEAEKTAEATQEKMPEIGSAKNTQLAKAAEHRGQQEEQVQVMSSTSGAQFP